MGVLYLVCYGARESSSAVAEVAARDALIVVTSGFTRWAFLPTKPPDALLRHCFVRVVTTLEITPLVVWAYLKGALTRCPATLNVPLAAYVAGNHGTTNLVGQAAGAVWAAFRRRSRFCGGHVADMPPRNRLFPKMSSLRQCCDCGVGGFARHFAALTPVASLLFPDALLRFAFAGSFAWEATLDVTAERRSPVRGEAVDVRYEVTRFTVSFVVNLGGEGLRRLGRREDIAALADEAVRSHVADMGFPGADIVTLHTDAAPAVRYRLTRDPDNESRGAMCPLCYVSGSPRGDSVLVDVTLDGGDN